jgi:hypothetical protein
MSTPMNIPDFLSLRSQRFGEHLRSKGVELPERFDLRSTARSLGGNLLALDSDPEQGPEVNEREMSARFIISTPCKDRAGDVVIPRGCLPHLDSYRRNPVSFFSHRSTDYPIGALRKDPSSPLELDVQDDRILARIYFHGMTADSELVFKLVKAGILRATSIGFIPHVAALIRDLDDEDKDDKNGLGEHLIYFGENKAKVFPGLRFHSWELTEVSVVPIGMNPEALQMSLSRGHVEGQVLTPTIKKILEPFASPRKTWSPGALLESIPAPVEVPPPPHPKETLVLIQDDTPEVLQTQKDLPPMPAPASDKPQDPYAGWSHGAKFLDGTIKKLAATKAYMNEECSLLDQPRVKRYAEKKIFRLERDIHKIQKLGATLYPEKFEDPGELKALDPHQVKDVPPPAPETPEIQKDLPVPASAPAVEEKSQTPPSLTPIGDALNLELICTELAALNERYDRIDEKFYSLTGKE